MKKKSFYINVLFIIVFTLTGCKEEVILQVPEVTTFSVTDIAYQSATCGGYVNSVGTEIISRGICFSTKPTPTISDSISISETENGSFTIYLNNLKPDSAYYLRAFATNKIGTGYGSVMRFKTKRTSISVTTTQPKMILFNTLQSGGTVTTSNGVKLTGQGICWSLSAYPTIDDSVQTVTSNSNNFSSTFRSLKNNTLYYLRAFASTNNELIYGENITFKTRTENLSVTPPTITVTASSFICSGTVTSTQPNSVTARGICWNTTGLPTINDNKTSEGTGNGYFESTIMKQSGVSTYYIRTYATDSEGTVYGDIVPNKIGVPTVQTISIIKSGTNYPILKGQIVSEGNAPTTDCGFHIQNISGGSESGGNAFTANPFSFTLYNLSPGRTYFIRAYAKNSLGVAYGNVIVYMN